jgi:hypothetical protein
LYTHTHTHTHTQMRGNEIEREKKRMEDGKETMHYAILYTSIFIYILTHTHIYI